MAITIQGTPPALSSVQDDLIYTVAEVAHTADPIGFPNYKFVGEVYIGGINVNTLKKVPDPVTNIGIFNVGQVVRNYIAAIFNPLPANILAQTMGDGVFSLSVQMKFGEEYSYTTYTNLVSDSARTFFNNYNGRNQVSSLTGLTDKFLSDRPQVTPVKCNSAFNFIPYFPSTTADFDITFKSYDYSNTLVTTFSDTFTPFANQLHIFNASKDAINASSPGMINDSIKYYTVEIGANLYQFNRDCECIYEVFTLHFLNKYGGFESKDFAKVSRKTISIEKKDFGKLPYTVDPSGVVSYKSANNVYNESRSVYSSQFKEKMILNSDLLTDAEYTWLEQLVQSPMVYMEDGGSFYPIVITETNYEPKKYVNEFEMSNLTINIEFGESMNAQFR